MGSMSKAPQGPTHPSRLSIRFDPPKHEGDPGYIGAVLRDDPLPGETWERSADFADGAWSEETLEKVIADLRAFFQTGDRRRS